MHTYNTFLTHTNTYVYNIVGSTMCGSGIVFDMRKNVEIVKRNEIFFLTQSRRYVILMFSKARALYDATKKM